MYSHTSFSTPIPGLFITIVLYTCTYTCMCTAMTYRILVVGEGKHFGLSTACLYVNLAGEVGESGTVEVPRGEYQTEVTVSLLFWMIQNYSNNPPLFND